MASKVLMEALSPTMEEGRLVEWKKNEGDPIRIGDVFAEVETDKAVMELVARAEGDVAFLAMDLDYYGLTGLSRHFIDTFIRRSQDPGLLTMVNFYKCYRAYLRGKIGLFTAGDPAVEEAVRDSCLTSAGKYFQLAHQYAAG